jgi:tRNA A-37 threonylcarbamoyl transferase component Bud32
MFRQRAPWWMYLLAACYLGHAALVVYVEFRGTEDPGVELASLLGPGPAVVRAIVPGSAAVRAGIEPGDRLVAFEGRSIRNALDWGYALDDAEAGRPLRVGIERRGEAREVVLTLGRRTRGPRDAADWVRLARALLAFSLAAVIAFSRPHDLQARVGAWLLAEVGLFGLFFLNPRLTGIHATVRELPLPLAAIVQAPLASPGGALLFAFAAIFPRPLFRAWWAWALVWLPQAAVMAIRAYYHIYLSDQLVRLPGWLKPVGALYFVAAVVVFVVNYRRLEDRNERRRSRVVAAGTVALIVAVLPYLVMLSPGAPVAKLESIFLSPDVFVALNLLSAAFPLSIAYAILRHRAFDISVVIRQGLRYAVARRTLLALLPILGAILVADLLLHSDQPLAVVLRERGWVHAALAGAALLAQRRRREWMDALDRRFFRERYDAQRLLREVAEQVREAGSFEQAARRVAAQIEAALHTEFAAVLLRHPREVRYAAVAAAPAEASPPALPAGSKLLNMIRVLGKPVELALTETGWLKQHLPHEETQFLRQARIEWLIPIATTEGRTEALLAVGFKRSEEPYTREDQDLLLAIAASMSLLLERPAAAARVPSGGAFEECSACGSLYDAGAARCSHDGAMLNLVQLPRLLAERYRLDRRLGGGGMGTVYEATDTELERRVAVKVMREDMAGNPVAAERFRREARTAAAFSHPNVVTVHDFGVAAASRAFLVMELLEGVDLRGELRQKRRLAAHRVLEVLRGVCAALEAAHERGLIHRDIKPENIFLARSAGIEVPKVLDFGVAKFVSASAPTQSMAATGAGQLVGTLRYMSPEQLRGDPAAPAWDLWALGVVSYEILAGEYPFEGASMPEWHAAVMAGRFTPLVRRLPPAPAEWEEFFRRALAADARQRPGAASEFLLELEKTLAR